MTAYRTVSLEEMLAEESDESRQKIAQMTAELIAEELTLRELRRLRKLTQATLSKKLKIGQEGVSRIEKRTDLYLSTLRSYVEGVGGKLSLVVEFPDRPPVILSGLGAEERSEEHEFMEANQALNTGTVVGMSFQVLGENGSGSDAPSEPHLGYSKSLVK
jgi:transcriptional regulator with XRE-family HTH domain